ncbi:hypothetical protein FQZ97_682680 [compost metagenome]
MAHIGHELLFQRRGALCNFFFFFGYFNFIFDLQVTQFVERILMENFFFEFFICLHMLVCPWNIVEGIEQL